MNFIRRAVLRLLLIGLLSPWLGAAAPADLAPRLDAIFARWDKPGSPGVIVGVARAGQVLHARGYGQANLEHAIPLAAESVSESGSVAKQFTAAAVALLAVREKLSLDDPVRRYLPELSEELAGGITVRMLLNHTSGLRDIHGLFDLLGRPSYTAGHDNAEVLRVMSRQRSLNFPPGSEYLYCNASYILAAVIVERVSGEGFNAFCTRELFAPHGLRQTRWRDDHAAIVPGRASGYEPIRGGGFRLDTPHSNLVGNGGLLTTVGDLLRWNAGFDGATGEWAKVVRLLQTRAQLSDGRTLDYALGLMVDDTPGQSQIFHGGATSGYRTFLTRYPDHGLDIAVLANVADFDATAAARQIARIVLELPPPPAPPARDPGRAGDAADWAGLYHCGQTDELLRLASRAGRLTAGSTALVATGPQTFATASGRTTYAFAGTARAPGRQLTLQATNGTTHYVAVAEVAPAPDALAAYSGLYYSEELDVTRRIEVQRGKLVFSFWPAAPVAAIPTFADGFQAPGGWHATFVRDSAGRITGVVLSNGRCRRVKFVRR
jgi:CubicO group peptidase (beta-lactamase class C family)